ncbi:hypothetical protein BH24CHL8_BH24CHL8_11350 [soil metagenome]
MALLGVALLTGGCAGASASTTLEVVARYSRFEPSSVTVAAGRPIHFVLRNEDPIDHEWIVGDEAVHAAHRDATEPAHGERPTELSVPALSLVRTTVTFDEPGRYRFVCHLPGHEAYGMAGTVIVTGS